MACLFLFALTSAISNYRLFIAFFFDSSYVSHRIEFGRRLLPMVDASLKSARLFLLGHDHAHSVHFPLIIISVGFAAFISIRKSKYTYPLLGGLSFLVASSLLHGFKNVSFFTPLHEAIQSIVPIQYDRFYTLSPFVWYSLFALSLIVILLYVRGSRFLVCILLLCQSLFITSKNFPLRAEVACMFMRQCENPTYSQFYSEELFSQIKNFIGRPVHTYKVLSLGIHPSIASFNGLHTLDGYMADYPLSYKHKFRSIISAELEKNDRKRAYFDKWGSRAYVFTEQDFGQMVLKSSYSPVRVVRNLELDSRQVSRLGGEYLISSLPIDLKSSPGLEFLKVFKSNSSVWDIWLYRFS